MNDNDSEEDNEKVEEKKNKELKRNSLNRVKFEKRLKAEEIVSKYRNIGNVSKKVLSFECDICHKKCPTKYSLVYHRYIHSEVKPFKCKHCSKSSATARCLRRHIKCLHKPTIGCDVKGCGTYFHDSDALESHKKTQHDKLSRQIFQCQRPGCNKKFTTKSSMVGHMKRHGRHPCNVKGCGKYFNNSNALETHKKTHQDKLSRQIFQCERPGCDKRFTTKASMQLHMKSHRRNLSSNCVWPRCDTSIVTNQQMDSQYKPQIWKRTYGCQWPDCGQSFTSFSAFYVHNKQHNPYIFTPKKAFSTLL